MLRKLGKYEILDEIGHGGMATVYRAKDTRLDRLVAVKVMHPHLRAAPEARVRFAREAKSVAKLRHGNILEIYDSSEEDSEEAYIVTELLTGPTLKEFAESHLDHIPAEIAACFVIEIARALASAHGAGIVHRDVKPENVLLHEARCMKLTDFGIAQMVGGQSFTATGQILGSPGHMAPEQVEGGDCDERTDVFSLGTVLYYLATGRLPFAGKNPHQVLKRIVDVDYPDPLRVRPSIGGRLRAIIVKSLARDPADRYQSARELESELCAFVAEADIDDPSAMLARYLPEPEKVAAELRAATIPRLTQRGKRRADQGDVPGALDDFNRVLALDEGNAQVLELIERIGRRSRQRTWLMAGGGILGAFGLAAMAYALITNGPDDEVAIAEADTPSGFEAVIEPERDASSSARDAARAVARTDGDAGARSADVEVTSVARAQKRIDTARHHDGPVTVVFSPQRCAEVEISVDGSPARRFGAAFDSVEVEPGRHEFRFVGSAQCGDHTVEVVVPPQERYVLSPVIPFAHARLLVMTNVPAQISVDDGRVTGPNNDIVEVPVTSVQAEVRLTVTAPGHTAYTGAVRLTAGQTSTTRVNLEASGSSP